MTDLHTKLAEALERDGIVILPNRVDLPILRAAQTAFEGRLRTRRWNTTDGYEQNERWRRMVEDLFLVAPQFTQIALDEEALKILDLYFDGQPYRLTEARGWQTKKTRTQFHNWHNDAWYDQSLPEIPKQVKLGVYLTDVTSGYFSYVTGTHLLNLRPSHWNDRQVSDVGRPIIDVIGPAGTMFLFDTSGIHRQSAPILEPRNALMFNYHDVTTPIQSLDKSFGRYSAVRIDVRGLQELNDKQRKILGATDAPVSTEEESDASIDQSNKRFRYTHALIDILLFARLEMQHAYEQILRPLQGIRRRMNKH